MYNLEWSKPFCWFKPPHNWALESTNSIWLQWSISIRRVWPVSKVQIKCVLIKNICSCLYVLLLLREGVDWSVQSVKQEPDVQIPDNVPFSLIRNKCNSYKPSYLVVKPCKLVDRTGSTCIYLRVFIKWHTTLKNSYLNFTPCLYNIAGYPCFTFKKLA